MYNLNSLSIDRKLGFHHPFASRNSRNKVELYKFHNYGNNYAGYNKVKNKNNSIQENWKVHTGQLRMKHQSQLINQLTIIINKAN